RIGIAIHAIDDVVHAGFGVEIGWTAFVIIGITPQLGFQSLSSRIMRFSFVGQSRQLLICERSPRSCRCNARCISLSQWLMGVTGGGGLRIFALTGSPTLCGNRLRWVACQVRC